MRWNSRFCPKHQCQLLLLVLLVFVLVLVLLLVLSNSGSSDFVGGRSRNTCNFEEKNMIARDRKFFKFFKFLIIILACWNRRCLVLILTTSSCMMLKLKRPISSQKSNRCQMNDAKVCTANLLPSKNQENSWYCFSTLAGQFVHKLPIAKFRFRLWPRNLLLELTEICLNNLEFLMETCFSRYCSGYQLSIGTPRLLGAYS